MILAFFVVAAAVPASCYPINSDRIYARDLAAAAPAFASLSPDTELGYSPAPGMQRVFHAAELRHLAQMHHLTIDSPTDVCFAWRTAVPTREDVFAAMKDSLKGRTARIEIVEQSLMAAPIGKPVFPLSGLCGFSTESVVWRGYIEYGMNHRFAIWARVRVSVTETRLVATETLTAGAPLRASQLRIDTYEGPLARQETVTDLKDAVGMIARFDISSGTVLVRNMLDKPKDVERGDTVAVIVEYGSARIEAQGVAEQAGQIGAVITVHNSKTGRKFRARVEDKDKVLVVPGGPAGLVTEESKS
jgi:flagella basal body P-ring formation protein FlgA